LDLAVVKELPLASTPEWQGISRVPWERLIEIEVALSIPGFSSNPRTQKTVFLAYSKKNEVRK